MFVERDTGARHYFEVPLKRALEIYNTAISEVSGIARTVRGPSMSAAPGKVHIVGEVMLPNASGECTEKALALKFLQGRNPSWTGQLFFARDNPEATWLDDLKPFYGDEFFFERELSVMMKNDTPSGALFPLTTAR